MSHFVRINGCNVSRAWLRKNSPEVLAETVEHELPEKPRGDELELKVIPVVPSPVPPPAVPRNVIPDLLAMQREAERELGETRCTDLVRDRLSISRGLLELAVRGETIDPGKIMTILVGVASCIGSPHWSNRFLGKLGQLQGTGV